MKKPSIVLTFDYEIFFGNKSGSFLKCIYEPVEELRKIMTESEIKGVFFIDILYYIKLLEVSELKNESILMKKQIQDLIRDGHSVELHLHPHWLNANFKNGNWNFSYDKYRFDQLTKKEQEYIFKVGIEVLKEIGKEVKKDYEILGYRAGGWCIQPFYKFRPYFKNYKLKYDSSVMSNINIESTIHKINFSEFPLKEVYRFSEKIEQEDIDGDIIEYKITSYNYNLFDKILNKLYKVIKAEKIFGDGKGIIINNNKNLFDRIKTEKYCYSLEGVNYKKIIFRKLKKEKNKQVVFISHPKNMTKEGISFIKKLKEEKYIFKKFDV